MAALHIVSKSPTANSALADCLRACDERAQILLIEDAVAAALRNSEWARRLHASGHVVCVLDADCDARGMRDRIDAAFAVIDHAQFVQLCCEYTPIVSWY